MLYGRAAKVAVDQLLADRQRYGFLVLAYVFMPDHAHLIVVPADGFDISRTVRVVKGSIAKRVNRELGASGALWQEGFRDDVAFTMRELNRYITYIHENPVTARLCETATQYPYSSAHGQCSDDYRRFLEDERDG